MERKMANLLSKRFEKYTGIAQSFRRDITSGQFFGASNQKRLQTHDTETATFGDIMVPANFIYSIECKHYKSPPSLNAIIKQDWKLLDDWISQAKQDAQNAGKKWLLIVKFNNIDEFVVSDDLRGGIIRYRGSDIVPLKVFLEQSDECFFS